MLIWDSLYHGGAADRPEHVRDTVFPYRKVACVMRTGLLLSRDSWQTGKCSYCFSTLVLGDSSITRTRSRQENSPRPTNALAIRQQRYVPLIILVTFCRSSNGQVMSVIRFGGPVSRHWCPNFSWKLFFLPFF